MAHRDKAASQTELHNLANLLRELALALDEISSGNHHGIQADVSIDDWVLAKRAVPILVGRTNGHPKIKDGNVGATTEIFFIDTTVGLARSLNRWYRLGPGVTDQSVLQ